MPSIAQVSRKGWVVIPKEIRKECGLVPGSKVAFVKQDRAVLLLPLPGDPISAARGILKEYDLTAALLSERAGERAAEERELKGE